MSNRIGNGLVVGVIGVVLATTAARWLITPMAHPEASSGRTIAVGVQLVAGIAIAILESRRANQAALVS